MTQNTFTTFLSNSPFSWRKITQCVFIFFCLLFANHVQAQCSISFNIYPSGDGNICSGQSSDESILLSSSELNVTYTLKNSAGSTILIFMGASPGMVLDFGPQPAGTYYVEATDGSCIFISGSLTITETVCCPNILYVNAAVSGGTGNGSSWANAYSSLSDALAAAHACPSPKTIKVAAGTYKPTKKPFTNGVELTTTDDKDKTFHVPDAVTIEGGYNATTGVRNVGANPTILSGDIGVANVSTDNAYHVVLALAAISGGVGTKIDGFTIKDGNANDAAFSSLTVSSRSVGRYFGAAIYSSYGANTITNNTILNNIGYFGGAIYAYYGTNTISSNTIYDNTANSGGAISTSYATNVILNNALFNNTASTTGGAIYTEGSSNTVRNNTFYSNTATSTGGALYFQTNGTNNLSNNIFWVNKKGTATNVAGADFYCSSSSTNTFNNNLLQLTNNDYTSANFNALGTNGTANIFNQDPLFTNVANPAGADGIHRSADDGFMPLSGSPTISAGTITSAPTTDITGAARSGNPDMGAYETSCTTPTIYGLTGGGSYCLIQPSNIQVGVANSQIGVSYQLRRGSTNVGSAIVGTGAAISFGNQIAGTYTVFATRIAGGCSATMTGSVVITGNNSCCPSSNILHVNASAVGTGDGSSWANAYASLSDALMAAHVCTVVKTIKVATGTYIPTKKPFTNGVELTTTDDRDKTFHVPDGVTIEGGYNAATGSRDIATNPTVLSGDIGTANVQTDNAYHVVLAVAPVSAPIGVKIDGFTITGGNAIEPTFSSLVVNSRSIGRHFGGAISVAYGVNTISNNTLLDNVGHFGGAIRFFYGTNTVSNNSIYNNTGNSGAAILTSYSNNTIINNALFNNTASSSGGAIYTEGSSSTIRNNTIYNNTASSNGGAILFHINGTNTLTNNIFWDNKKGTATNVAGADFYSHASSTNVFNNNVLQLASTAYTSTNLNALGTNASGNIFNQNPLFSNTANPAGADGIHRSADDGLMPQAGSPVINSGTAAGAPTTDVTGAARNGNPDIGAYEYLLTCSTPTVYNVTGGGSYCNGVSNVSIGLSGSQTDVSYQLKNGSNANVGSAIVGTGAAISFGNQIAGTYSVVATKTIGGCSATMMGTKTITEGTIPNVVLTVTDNCGHSILETNGNAASYTWSNGAVGNNIIVNDAGLYTVTASDAGNNCFFIQNIVAMPRTVPTVSAMVTNNCGSSTLSASTPSGVNTYLWSNNQTTPTITVSNAGNYSVTVTNGEGCTASVSVAAMPSSGSTLYNVTGDGTYCLGSSGVEVGLSGSETGISYQLKNGSNANVGAAIAGTGSAISFGNQTAGMYYVAATNPSTSCTSVMSDSAFISVDTAPAAFDLATVPANILIDCNNAVPPPATVLATSPCMTVTMTETSTKSTDPNACAYYSYVITRTWKVTNKQGNSKTVKQTITVRDITAPTMTGVPANITVHPSAIPAVTNPIAIDNCSTPSIAFTTSSITVPPTATAACYNYYELITRTWTASDACGRFVSGTQKITVIDVPISCPANLTLNTSTGLNTVSTSAVSAANIIATPLAGCAITNLKYTLSGATTLTTAASGKVAKALNLGVTTVNYSLLNSTCSFNITVKDAQAPTISGTAAVTIDACTFPSTLPRATFATDNSGITPTLSIVSDITSSPTTACAAKPTATQKFTQQITRTWLATDNAGNTATATQMYYLRDMVAPIALCKAITVVIPSTAASVNVLATAIDNASWDNCTTQNLLTFGICRGAGCTTSTTSISVPKTLITGTSTSANVPLTLRVKDICGNQGVCQTSLTLIKASTLGSNSNSNQYNEITPADTEETSSTNVENSDIDATHGSLKVFPNPFSEDLNLEFNLTQDVQRLVLKVYDNQGRVVETNERGEALTGYYQMRWNLSNLSAGMYHICLELDGKCTKVERVIMMK